MKIKQFLKLPPSNETGTLKKPKEWQRWRDDRQFHTSRFHGVKPTIVWEYSPFWKVLLEWSIIKPLLKPYLVFLSCWTNITNSLCISMKFEIHSNIMLRCLHSAACCLSYPNQSSTKVGTILLSNSVKSRLRWFVTPELTAISAPEKWWLVQITFLFKW